MPQSTPLDPKLVAKFEQWQQDSALPAVILDGVGPALPAPGGSRIGGPAFLPDGAEWPMDKEGAPMSFLAQLDFAELPKLEDYPESGVLQFFIARDIHFGADIRKPGEGDFRVVYLPDTGIPGALRASRYDGRNGEDYYSPLYEERVRTSGVRLAGTPGRIAPHVFSFTLRRDLPEILTGNNYGILNAMIEEGIPDSSEQHHMGGHPQFTQDDWRVTPELQQADRVLLNLWSQDGLMWGDAGQGQFMISREDLKARRFDRAYYSWDSS